jgi:peptidoglycan-associated lipoprotein
VNTPGDELTPFFQNNRLYFSTEGRPTLGGYDIYYCDWDGEQFSDAQNMGAGYNTSYDDLSFSINSAGNRGFIVSNRPAEGSRSIKSKTCCDEVFEFELRDIVIDLLAQVVENETPLTGAKVTLFEIENRQPGKSTSKQSDESSIFQFLLDSDKAYKVVAELEGYYPGEVSFNTTGIVDEYTVKKLIRLERLPETAKDVEIVMINEPIRLNQIYYDFDDDKILPDAEKDLSYLIELMNQYPDMIIELSSHTDAQGNDDYNDRLSLRRAQSAKNWITSRGVSSSRIEAVGYGEQQIINHCINGMDCTDDEHRVNRRTEFKIIAGPTSIEIKKELQGGDTGSSEKKN